MISLLVLFPLIGAAAVLLTARDNPAVIRRVAAWSCGASLLLALLLVFSFDRFAGGVQFEMRRPWVESLGISFHAGLDGISAVMILLHGLVSFSGALVSYSIKERVKEYFVFYLLLVASIYGVFISLDVFFLYLFYEMAVIPMYPLIGIWGSKNKEYATMKLTLFITAGAVLALVGIIAVYQMAGLKSFDLIELQRHFAVQPLPQRFQKWAFPFLVFGFGVIASLWPTHSWSPIGYAAAPSAVSMIHAGVLKKLGPYLILRLALGFMPDGARIWLPVVAALAMVNILYAGYCAMVQKDLKFIIGFSSVSHMGYILLGLACLNEAGLTGAVLLMFSHGVMAASAFSLIGFVYDQTHTRRVDELGGGLARKVPFIAVCFIMTAMASLGLPGFSNFISEILIFFGSWKVFPLFAAIGIFGVLVTSIYLLRTVKQVFYGPQTVSWEGLKDAVTVRARAPYLILIGALLVAGFFPQLLVGRIRSGVEPLVTAVRWSEETRLSSSSTVWKVYGDGGR
ncbi:MAG: NADH-quinone oxidoreductase subunit M [Candidatus Omnitrophica bacterium]|nr:NADH-quinone oxidoreductase subunit M [Candidatus Omnitrophota bacterium]